MEIQTAIPAAPAGYATVNAFVIARDVEQVIEFVRQAFGGTERPEVRTVDHDGLLLHAELVVGNATIMFADRKADWPFTPSLLQVYVDDVEAALRTARELGGTVVTKPTDFFGDIFSRIRDPQGNMWWVYQHGAGSEWVGDEGGDWSADGGAEGSAEWDSSPELSYIHDTLLPAMRELTDPGRR